MFVYTLIFFIINIRLNPLELKYSSRREEEDQAKKKKVSKFLEHSIMEFPYRF